MATPTKTIRLRPGLRAAIERLARRTRRSFSEVTRTLLEEAILVQACPGIYFADEPAGRVAKISGTGLAVWEVIRDYKSVKRDEKKLGSGCLTSHRRSSRRRPSSMRSAGMRSMQRSRTTRRRTPKAGPRRSRFPAGREVLPRRGSRTGHGVGLRKRGVDDVSTNEVGNIGLGGHRKARLCRRTTPGPGEQKCTRLWSAWPCERPIKGILTRESAVCADQRNASRQCRRYDHRRLMRDRPGRYRRRLGRV